MRESLTERKGHKESKRKGQGGSEIKSKGERMIDGKLQKKNSESKRESEKKTRKSGIE